MTVEVVNFGCRLNIYEGEVIRSQAQAAGLEGAIIFNSCAVTSEAERQLRQSIRRAHKEHPEAKIIVTGCAAQINPQLYAQMEEVDSVIGNVEKLDSQSYMQRHPRKGGDPLAKNPIELERIDSRLRGNDAKILVNDIMSVKETASHLITSFEGKARAFLQVQNGCDHRCTFCIIPYGRGNSRSVPLGDIVAHARKLVESGYQEIVLTGVDVSDYGKDLPGQPTLGQMMKRLLALMPELPRLRLSSIDAVEVDDDIYTLLADEQRLMPHIHISLQAGDDMILKRMKRRHTRQDVLDFCAKLRTLRPDIVFGADIIAGFPTETEEMFQNTLNIVSEAQLTYLHVFPYSARTGTPAARMPQIPKAVRKERAARLRTAGEKQLAAYLQSHIGKTLPVLVENGREGREGRTPHFALVELDKPCTPGSVVEVHIGDATPHSLRGLVTSPHHAAAA